MNLNILLAYSNHEFIEKTVNRKVIFTIENVERNLQTLFSFYQETYIKGFMIVAAKRNKKIRREKICKIQLTILLNNMFMSEIYTRYSIS